jgi:hypothetical protein
MVGGTRFLLKRKHTRVDARAASRRPHPFPRLASTGLRRRKRHPRPPNYLRRPRPDNQRLELTGPERGAAPRVRSALQLSRQTVVWPVQSHQVGFQRSAQCSHASPFGPPLADRTDLLTVSRLGPSIAAVNGAAG